MAYSSLPLTSQVSAHQGDALFKNSPKINLLVRTVVNFRIEDSEAIIYTPVGYEECSRCSQPAGQINGANGGPVRSLSRQISCISCNHVRHCSFLDKITAYLTCDRRAPAGSESG